MSSANMESTLKGKKSFRHYPIFIFIPDRIELKKKLSLFVPLRTEDVADSIISDVLMPAMLIKLRLKVLYNLYF
jgi:hypothetical protein